MARLRPRYQHFEVELVPVGTRGARAPRGDDASSSLPRNPRTTAPGDLVLASELADRLPDQFALGKVARAVLLERSGITWINLCHLRAVWSAWCRHASVGP